MPRLINTPTWLNEDYDRESQRLIRRVDEAFPFAAPSSEALAPYLGSDLPEDRDSGRFLQKAVGNEELVWLNTAIVYSSNEEIFRAVLPGLLFGSLKLLDTAPSPAEGETPRILPWQSRACIRCNA